MNRPPAWRLALKVNEIIQADRRQMQHRNQRLAEIRKAGARARRLERERKARLEAETAAILASPRSQLRKASKT
jgi:hypothetical protein